MIERIIAPMPITPSNERTDETVKVESPRTQTVTELLRALLLDGSLRAEERLSELRLTQHFKVSRTPVRAALQTLAAEGLLDYTPNRGYAVRSFAVAEIMDAYEMRALAEGLAAKLAAERGLNALQQTQLDDALTLGDRVLYADDAIPSQQREIYSTINEQFHRTIHAAASSRLILDVVRSCQRIPQASTRNIMAFQIEDIRGRHAAHHQIYEAIVFRQPTQAEALMRDHVLAVKVSAARALLRADIAKPASIPASDVADPLRSGVHP